MRSRSITRFTAALLVGGLFVATGPRSFAEAGPAPAAPADPGSAALDWLEGELADDGGYLTNSYDAGGGGVGVADDWGLTLDAVLALTADGRGDEPAATTAQGLVADHISSYISGVDFGSPTDRYAGPIAKALLSAEIAGDDVNDFGGVDLEAELLARLQATGADAGRFADKSDFGDYSNGFGQAFGIMALQRLDGAPASAVAFLLDQQCPGGGFRGNYSTSGGCTDDGDATVDATAMALMALVTLEPDCTGNEAIAQAIDWLEDGQNDAGAFGGESGSNTNSTGLAAVILRSLGHTTAADSAAAFIAGLQLTSGDDQGGIALNASGFAAGADGVQILERDGFRRATGQAVLAFDAPSYAELGADPVDPDAFAPCPASPPPTTTPKATLSATTVVAGGTLTVTGTGFDPGETVHGTLHSALIDLGTVTASADGTAALTFTVPADLEAGVHTVTLTGETSGTTVSTAVEVTAAESPQTLPATGSHAGQEGTTGAALVVLGVALLLGSRRLFRTRTVPTP